MDALDFIEKLENFCSSEEEYKIVLVNNKKERDIYYTLNIIQEASILVCGGIRDDLTPLSAKELLLEVKKEYDYVKDGPRSIHHKGAVPDIEIDWGKSDGCVDDFKIVLRKRTKKVRLIIQD